MLRLHDGVETLVSLGGVVDDIEVAFEGRCASTYQVLGLFRVECIVPSVAGGGPASGLANVVEGGGVRVGFGASCRGKGPVGHVIGLAAARGWAHDGGLGAMSGDAGARHDGVGARPGGLAHMQLAEAVGEVSVGLRKGIGQCGVLVLAMFPVGVFRGHLFRIAMFGQCARARTGRDLTRTAPLHTHSPLRALSSRALLPPSWTGDDPSRRVWRGVSGGIGAVPTLVLRFGANDPVYSSRSWWYAQERSEGRDGEAEAERERGGEGGGEGGER